MSKAAQFAIPKNLLPPFSTGNFEVRGVLVTRRHTSTNKHVTSQTAILRMKTVRIAYLTN
jgi:hypothetical protein